nr:hypothetical protein [Tanacetum cinerariifolium]
MFDTYVLNDEEMFAKSVDVVKQGNKIVADKDIIDDITLAKALMEIKVTAAGIRPKAKSIAMQEPNKKERQISFDEQEARRLQAEIDGKDRLAKEKAQQIEDENLAWDHVQAMIDADYELAIRLQEEDQGELTVEENSKRAGDKLDKERSKKQDVEDNKEQEELKRCLEIIPDDGDEEHEEEEEELYRDLNINLQRSNAEMTDAQQENVQAN